MDKEKGSNVYSNGEAYVPSGDGDLPPQILHDEVKAIIRRRAKEGLPVPEAPGKDVTPTTALGLTGLSISGGGIRSATFSLGVMQALAKADVLKNFDYMSTVSGGGYSGSSLTWALYGQPETKDSEHREFIKSMGVGPDSFPIGTDDPRLEVPANADPDRRDLLKYLREHGKYLTPGGGVSPLSCLGVLLRGILLNMLVWISLGTCLIYFTRVGGYGAVFKSWSATLWLLAGFAAVSILYSVATFFRLPGRLRYRSRRLFERVSVYFFVALAFALTIGTLGWVHHEVQNYVKSLSVGMIASGAASGLWAYLQTASRQPEQKSKVPVSLVATVASLLLLYGGVLGAYAWADWGVGKLGGKHFWAYVLLGVTLFTGWIVNINYISLHRFYRDRLMETFLPGIDRAVEDVTGASPQADDAKISAMWNDANPRGPYHIINTNLVTVDSKLRTARTRGGDNFILSPFYCGGTISGWRRTEQFERNSMTLATAMAISAAAANPNTGVGGEGLSRNKFVSVLMALLNLRLGYWTHRPSRARSVWFSPNHFWPGGAYELMGLFKETSIWQQLTDGGHFENLALYEMVRRRLKLIVVLDGGADPDFVFSDLQNASRRIGTDFGARIEFSEDLSTLTYKRWTKDEEEGVASSAEARSGSSGYPKYGAIANKGWIHGTIHYAGGKDKGNLIYIKTTMVKGLSITTQGYKDKHPTFPDQTTADQFFEPEQFSAYRELGYVIGEDAAKKIRELV